MGIRVIALVWGLAEATLFFIVPDVWLSYVGREKLKPGLVACLFTLIGALLGGTFMYAWGAHAPDSAFQTLEKIPGISPPLIRQAVQTLEHEGAQSIMLAPLKGAPYKIYAVQAGYAGVPFWQFFLITIPARLIRFIAVTTLVHLALKTVMGKKTARARRIAFCTGWLVFYIAYFSVMGW